MPTSICPSSWTVKLNSSAGSSASRGPRCGATHSPSKHSWKQRGARLMNLTYPCVFGYPYEPNSSLLDLCMLLNLTLPYVLWILFCTLLSVI